MLNLRKHKGITLVALVVTIIILLILAGISISVLGGENGLFNVAKKATQEYAINEAKEELQMAIMNLRIEEESKGDKLEKEDLPRLNNDKIDVGDVSAFPVEIIYEKFLFNIDEYYNVIYRGESDRTLITYTTNPEGYTNKDSIKVLIKVKNTKGIKNIEYPDGDKLDGNGKKEIAIDYTVTKNGTYTFKIFDIAGNEKTKDIVIYQIDKLEPKDFTITANGTIKKLIIEVNAEDADETDISVCSGIDKYEYYVKKSTETEYTKYNTNEIQGLSIGKYSIYVIAYDKAGNSKESEKIEIETSIEVSKISVGEEHLLLLDDDGNLWAMGNNSYGQLGDGTTNNSTQLKQISIEKKFKEIAASYRYSLAIDTDGFLWSWGNNKNGILGNGLEDEFVMEPTKISDEVKFKKIAISNNEQPSEFWLALDEDGNIWGVGTGALGNGTSSKELVKAEVGTTFKDISVGNKHSLALDENGYLWSCGDNLYGQLGDGTTNNSTQFKQIAIEKKFKEIEAESTHSYAIDEEGNLYAFGRNWEGVLGLGLENADRISIPTIVKEGTKFKKIQSSYYTTIAIDEDNKLYGWGMNNNSQLSISATNIPSQIDINVKIKDISMAYAKSILLDEKNDIWVCGAFWFGQYKTFTKINIK